MFEFKAYIWDTQVYIGSRAYKTNEILTECLNKIDPADELLMWLRDLEKLLPLVQNIDDDYEREKNYNKHVQRAQRLFHRIGDTLKRLPPYNHLPIQNMLDESLLFDCLNKNYDHWETGDPDYNLDYANEFGFVLQDHAGRYKFYVQRFQPFPKDVNEAPDTCATPFLMPPSMSACGIPPLPLISLKNGPKASTTMLQFPMQPRNWYASSLL